MKPTSISFQSNTESHHVTMIVQMAHLDQKAEFKYTFDFGTPHSDASVTDFRLGETLMLGADVKSVVLEPAKDNRGKHGLKLKFKIGATLISTSANDPICWSHGFSTVLDQTASSDFHQPCGGGRKSFNNREYIFVQCYNVTMWVPQDVYERLNEKNL
jgi:hypothetical protein